MTETQCALWVQLVFGPGSPIPKRILADFSSMRAFRDAGGTEWRLSGLFTGAQLDRLDSMPDADAQRLEQGCLRAGYSVIGLTDPAYPQRLREIRTAPAVLYVSGRLPDVDCCAAIALVGTREATPYGLQVASRLSMELCRQNAIVVSGGALGVDTAAHRGALLAGGTTIAVLGCGFNARYLMTNADLRRQIAHSGALVSEYPPDTPVRAGCFPMRNRIISGLSLGTVVVEAGEHSGALITARQALDQGRDVFAVPGNIVSCHSVGTNRLIQDGAKAVTCAQDILEDYPEYLTGKADAAAVTAEEKTPVPVFSESSEEGTVSVFSADPPQGTIPAVSAPSASQTSVNPVRSGVSRRAAETATAFDGACPAQKIPEQPVLPAEAEALSPSAKQLLAQLCPQPLPLDELTVRAGLSTREALAAVTELEMMDWIAVLPGKQIALK